MSHREVRESPGRQVGLYAAECIRIKELDTTAGLWGICSVLLEDTDSDDDDNEELLMVAAVVAAEKSESLRADIQYISESVERKYLRFHSPGLQSSFTQLFRFRAEEMPRLLHCLRMPPWFQLDNGDESALRTCAEWCNGKITENRKA